MVVAQKLPTTLKTTFLETRKFNFSYRVSGNSGNTEIRGIRASSLGCHPLLLLV